MSKCLVITGGSRGIGEQTIGVFIKQGWIVVNLSRSHCSIEGVVNIKIDLADPTSVINHTNDLLAAINPAKQIALVHNAAAFKRDNVISISDDSLREVLEINVVAAAALNKVFLPVMHPGSSIIYIGSTLSEMAVANRASYVISKHALVGLMRATCQDLVGKEVSTCCICPGFVNTAMLTGEVEKEILDNLIKQRVTQGRLIDPLEIAELIYFCATHPVINGEVIHANLGQITS